MSHPSLFKPTVVQTTPSRRLNTLAARAQAAGMHVAMHRTIPASNKYSAQYRLRITVPHPGLHSLEILASRGKSRWPLQPWHFYLSYAIKGEMLYARHMSRWNASLVEEHYARARHAQLLLAIARTLAS